jgi:formiminotetrahydrofolate cyclodeaminase
VQRTDDIVSFVGTLPDTLPVEVAGFSYTVQVAEYTGDVTAVVRATAIDLAANSVFIVLQLAMFTLVLYGLLLRPNAVADAVTGAFLAHSALEASLFTVRANLESIPDEGFVAEMEERAADIETRAETAFERVEANANSTS